MPIENNKFEARLRPWTRRVILPSFLRVRTSSQSVRIASKISKPMAQIPQTVSYSMSMASWRYAKYVYRAADVHSLVSTVLSAFYLPSLVLFRVLGNEFEILFVVLMPSMSSELRSILGPT